MNCQLFITIPQSASMQYHFGLSFIMYPLPNIDFFRWINSWDELAVNQGGANTWKLSLTSSRITLVFCYAEAIRFYWKVALLPLLEILRDIARRRGKFDHACMMQILRCSWSSFCHLHYCPDSNFKIMYAKSRYDCSIPYCNLPIWINSNLMYFQK